MLASPLDTWAWAGRPQVNVSVGTGKDLGLAGVKRRNVTPDILGMPYKMSLLNHVVAVQACARDFQVQAEIDIAEFRLTLIGRNRHYRLLPRFITAAEDGSPQYSAGVDD